MYVCLRLANNFMKKFEGKSFDRLSLMDVAQYKSLRASVDNSVEVNLIEDMRSTGTNS